MESSDRQLLKIASLTSLVFIAGYIIVNERTKALAERELSVWIHDNNIEEFTEHFYSAGIESYF